MPVVALFRIAALTILLSGCANLFRADFETDTPGQPPAASPPGPPAGDSISNGPAEVFFVSAEDAISGNQSLAIREPAANLDRGANTATFRTAEINDGDAPIYITWRGYFPSDQGGVRINAGILGQSFGNVTFENGQIFVMFDTPVGTYAAGDGHTVIISLFPASQTFRLAVVGEATLDEDFVEANMTPINGQPSNEAFVEFTPTASTALRRVYVLDDATISYSEP
ncbi:MAG: hypothetical protein R3E44_08730 [Paracoccaceae bacterium]